MAGTRCFCASRPLRITLLLAAIVLVYWLYHEDVTVPIAKIPNQVHYTYILDRPDTDFTFQFEHFLSIYSTWYYWRPRSIFLHTNAGEDQLESARQGKVGKWNRLIFNMPNLQVNHVEAPQTAENGVKIHQIEHKSDFVRVPAMWELGGTYMDWDAYALRDITPLRACGFAAIAGRELNGGLNCGVFMAKKGALLLEMWNQEMHRVYDGGWVTHSNQALTRLSKRLARLPGEVLIMEKDAFEPSGWTAEEKIKLFGIHNETASNLESMDDSPVFSSWPSYDENLTDRWDHPQDFPSWARDYSSSYILHAYNPAKNMNPIEGFEGITPEYVLARQSNFARLLYPVVKTMYEAGVLNVEDLYARE